MKRMLSMIFAGIIGGLITLGGVSYMNSQTPDQFLGTQNARQVTNLNVSAGKATATIPFDFVEASKKSREAVVHISASAGAKAKSETQEEENEDANPFKRFFGDDFFFGNPFGNEMPRQGTGSGVIYTSDGYIITNNHVVEFADEVEVTLFDNRTFTAKVVGTERKSDLAVLKIEASGLPTLEAADSDAAQIGEWVLAVGNPFDLNSTVTAGIISAKGRSIQLLGGGDAIEAFIQTDAAVNPGNSGGALVDTQGRLLGINTAIATRTGVFSGYSFAIPINLVTRVVDDIIEYGSFQRAFLGVNISELDSEYAEELGVGITQGVVVEKLIDGGSAQYAGLLPKDIIIEVDGKSVKNVPQLQEIVGRAQVGDTLVILVNRKGQVKEVPVKLKAG